MLVRNGSRIGIDWRAFAALAALALTLGGVLLTVLSERWTMLSHLRDDEPSRLEWQAHLNSIGDREIHLTREEYRMFRNRVEILWQFDARLSSLEAGQDLILEKMGLRLAVPRPKQIRINGREE